MWRPLPAIFHGFDGPQLHRSIINGATVERRRRFARDAREERERVIPRAGAGGEAVGVVAAAAGKAKAVAFWRHARTTGLASQGQSSRTEGGWHFGSSLSTTNHKNCNVAIVAKCFFRDTTLHPLSFWR